MNTEERNLITGLFDRMGQFGTPEKDRDADALIAQAVRANSDAPYMLVQSVLVQEQALQQADSRIQELEARVQELESASPRQAPAAAGGSFLGGMFGRGAPSQGMGSVPTTGRAPVSAPPTNSPWGRSAMQQGPQPAQAQSGGGGFLKTAMATAAGVAGGMLLANSIRGMMGGDSAPGAQTSSTDATTGEPIAGATETAAAPQYQDPNDNDPGTYDTSSNDSDFGGGDLDI